MTQFLDFWLRGELLPWKSAIGTISNGFPALKLVLGKNFSQIENDSIPWFLAQWRALALKISHRDYFQWIPRTQINIGAKFQPNWEWLNFLIIGSVESSCLENQPSGLFLMDSPHSNYSRGKILASFRMFQTVGTFLGKIGTFLGSFWQLEHF